ncbi:glycerophosphodiester phosphodiesterase [Acetobacteraceae bacterium KSS8]|uniref:glycerophosphodiester phosphodiesterase n=1 Tax=Endosaccharibacter trunci TaxID=2812733 RepID=A0ABT1WBK0_9PROT|nr:glycerophosphodiester phosphodiesterase [Acetobacteraceae bacterium KSS8]
MISSSRRALLAGGVSLAAGLGSFRASQAAQPYSTPSLAPKVLVIGHRGACALRPEHTLASYALAIEDGADFVEPDLVPTKDGVLVARHESNIAETTDVAERPEFAARRTTRTIDGVTETGWFTIDFTLAELKTLWCRERLPKLRPQNTRYNDQFQIVTFEEMMDFVAAESAARGRPIGLIPELKSTPFFRSVGLPTEELFLRTLERHRTAFDGPLEIQCFYGDSLRTLRQGLGRAHKNIRLMQLMDQPGGDFLPGPGNARFASWAEMMGPRGLAEVASYADVIGPNKEAIIPPAADKRMGTPTALVRDAHAAGLLVHPFTFRPENHFLPVDCRNGAGDAVRNPEGSIKEIRAHIQAGIDGFFTDDPAIGRQAVDRI